MIEVVHNNVSAQRKRKIGMLETFNQDCADSEGIFIAEYSGINVPDLAELRHAARNAGGRVRVVKNTVARIALNESEGFSQLAGHLSGQLIYGSGSSAQSIAKVLRDFAKDNESLEIKGGVVNGSYMDAAAVKQLASLPSLDQMLGIVAGTLNAPITSLARSLKEVTASIARALGAVRDSQSK